MFSELQFQYILKIHIDSIGDPIGNDHNYITNDLLHPKLAKTWGIQHVDDRVAVGSHVCLEVIPIYLDFSNLTSEHMLYQLVTKRLDPGKRLAQILPSSLGSLEVL